ncbi:RNA-binding S4 domain-containing protein [Ponticaulis sp.]|uniref:RNA-binding S4 domain-containing protein n=1 Tax=Ponticaulis sp. TaxID=2020902 RepID=UPI0025D7216F|nr:RNA-binding S4 domain-containing protein [Ponticaulis sp.]
MDETEQRLDIWLWRTRFFKMRADAAKAVSQKGVRIDRTGMVRKSQKPGATVCEGDVLTFRARGQVLTVRVLGLPARRGPAAEAQGFYDTLTEETGEQG